MLADSRHSAGAAWQGAHLVILAERSPVARAELELVHVVKVCAGAKQRLNARLPHRMGTGSEPTID